MILGLQDEDLEDIKILQTKGAYFFSNEIHPNVLLSFLPNIFFLYLRIKTN